MLVYRFVDLDLGVEIFEKEQTTEKWNVNFEMGNSGTSVHLYFGVEENFMQRLSTLLLFFFGGKKRITFKALLTCNFISGLLSCFNLLSYPS